jgi:hypothetical protein
VEDARHSSNPATVNGGFPRRNAGPGDFHLMLQVKTHGRWIHSGHL